MTTSAARDHGLRRVSDLTTWLGVGAVAVTGVFAGLAAHATHTSAAAGAGQAASTSPAGLPSAAPAGFTVTQPPAASTLRSHVRSGSS